MQPSSALLTIALACPEVVSRYPAIATGQALIFAVSPFALFTTVLMFCAASFPFWLVYLS
jgi:hypothetical protein